ncbi:GDP-L-galactose phosphorylase 1-like protein [Tanacetum coccineum]
MTRKNCSLNYGYGYAAPRDVAVAFEDFMRVRRVVLKEGNVIQANMVLNDTDFFNELGSKLPLYAFQRFKNIESSDKKVPPFAFLGSLLLKCEDCVKRGLFRYDVTACETKVIPGDYGFVAQLNERRHLKKRPTEFRVDKVLQPFDGSKFNFMKVGQEEILFQFESSDDGEVKFYPSAPIDAEKSPNVFAINVSPIEYGHVLLILRILECCLKRLKIIRKAESLLFEDWRFAARSFLSPLQMYSDVRSS